MICHTNYNDTSFDVIYGVVELSTPRYSIRVSHILVSQTLQCDTGCTRPKMTTSSNDVLTALARYRERMASSNRAYMTARILSIEQTPGTDKNHLDTLARHWHWNRWPPKNGLDSIQCPRDILSDDKAAESLYLNHDGTITPAPAPEQTLHLDQLSASVRSTSTIPDIHLPP